MPKRSVRFDQTVVICSDPFKYKIQELEKKLKPIMDSKALEASLFSDNYSNYCLISDNKKVKR